MRKISEILAEAKKRATPNADFVKSLRQKHIVPSIDRERYTDIPGMEGPYRAKKSGHIVYYDPKKGLYYDRDSDMYLDHDEAQARGLYEQFELDESHTLPVGTRVETKHGKGTIRKIDTSDKTPSYIVTHDHENPKLAFTANLRKKHVKKLDEASKPVSKPGHNQKVLNKNINKLLKVIKDRTPKEPENK